MGVASLSAKNHLGRKPVRETMDASSTCLLGAPSFTPRHPFFYKNHFVYHKNCRGHQLLQTIDSRKSARPLNLRFNATQQTGTEADVATPKTAADMVNLGISLFHKGRVRDALAQFDAALAMKLEPEEAQAALYNKACCHAYREEGEKASEALRKALRDYDLKSSVILNDPDMASFRAMPEFKQLQEEARKGGQDVGQGFRRDLKLIGEVQAPFRGVRKFFSVTLASAAGISTIINGPRLFRAIQGGENAPDLWETAQNLGINITGIVVFVGLFIWDTRKEEEQIARISRDETLSRLPLQIANSRIVELVQLRETTRPVILAGKKETVTRAIQRAEKYRSDLIKRGVLLVPLIWSSTKEEITKKRGFGTSGKAVPLSTPAEEDFDSRTKSIASKTIAQAEKRLKADVVSPAQWESWVMEQQEAEGVKPGEDVYIVLRLDGRVRKSGVGMPDWQELTKEIPPLDALVSKLER